MTRTPKTSPAGRSTGTGRAPESAVVERTPARESRLPAVPGAGRRDDPHERTAGDRDPRPGPVVQPGLSVPPPVTDGPGTPLSSSLPPVPGHAAGQPSPDPGECSPSRGRAAPGRGRRDALAGLRPGRPAEAGPAGQAPAGGEPSAGRADGTSSPPAGSRTFTIALPPGLKLLNLNDRGHWAARYRRAEALKKAAWAMALQQKIPKLERVSVVAEYQPGDLRLRDPDNLAMSAKAAIDGLRAAKVLPEDDSRHVTEVTCRIGSLYPKGRLVLYLTEVPGLPPEPPGRGSAA